MNYKHFSLFLVLAGLGCLLLACGPVAQAPNGEEPLIAAQSEPREPTAEPSTPETPTPEPTEPVKPTPEPKPTPRPTKAQILPTPAPDPAHPEGLAGCKTVGMFGDDADLAYQGWCGDQLLEHMIDTCRSLSTGDAQRECGNEIALEYNSLLFRNGAIKCAAIAPGSAAQSDCIGESAQSFDNSMDDLFKAWDLVRIAADQDEHVVKARENTVACLKDRGFENPKLELLFQWQAWDTPKEYLDNEAALSAAQKALRERLLKPSQECATEEGLFAAQEVAWAAELKRLKESNPQIVAGLIREGMLDELEKPGLATFVTGE